jgi:hypothetical protein
MDMSLQDHCSQYRHLVYKLFLGTLVSFVNMSRESK